MLWEEWQQLLQRHFSLRQQEGVSVAGLHLPGASKWDCGAGLVGQGASPRHDYMSWIPTLMGWKAGHDTARGQFTFTRAR